MATDDPSSAPLANPTQSSSSVDPPASPPLPSKPVPVAPGPRAARLQEVFADRLKSTLAKISYDNVASCYPTIAKKSPSTIKMFQERMVAVMAHQAQSRFDALLAERDVVRKLNELEGLMETAGRRKEEGEMEGREAPVAPHTLPPETILAAHLVPHLKSQQAQLSEELRAVRRSNAALFGEIGAQRDEAVRLLAAIEKVLADVGAASALLDGVPVAELAGESRDVEVEMAGV